MCTITNYTWKWSNYIEVDASLAQVTAIFNNAYFKFARGFAPSSRTIAARDSWNSTTKFMDVNTGMTVGRNGNRDDSGIRETREFAEHGNLREDLRDGSTRSRFAKRKYRRVGSERDT